MSPHSERTSRHSSSTSHIAHRTCTFYTGERPANCSHLLSSLTNFRSVVIVCGGKEIHRIDSLPLRLLGLLSPLSQGPKPARAKKSHRERGDTADQGRPPSGSIRSPSGPLRSAVQRKTNKTRPIRSLSHFQVQVTHSARRQLDESFCRSPPRSRRIRTRAREESPFRLLSHSDNGGASSPPHIAVHAF